MLLRFILSLPRPTLKCKPGGMRFELEFDGKLHGEPMMVEWQGESTYCDTASITFSDSEDPNTSGTIGFIPNWVDWEDGSSQPGFLEIRVRTSQQVLKAMLNKSPSIH